MTPEPIDRNRLSNVRTRVSKRMWLAILAALGIGTGTVVVVDQTRDRPRVDPPPVVEPPVRPPPRGDDPTRPPPVVPGEFAPEQFHEHSFYGDAIGNLTFTDCTFGPDWTTKPTTHYSTFDDKSGSHAGKSYTGVEWGTWGTSGLAHAVLNLYGPVQNNITFTDCAWLAAPDPNDGSPSTMRWGVRGFGMMDVVFDKCSFSRGMGAGTQVALRATAAHGNITPSGVHRYERCIYVGIGDPESERFGAFTISEHAPEGYGFDVADVEVEIIDCTLIGGHLDFVDGNGVQVKSSRGIMSNGRKRVEIRGLHMDYEKPLSGWSVQLWSVPDVLIADSYIREGLVEIRNPEKVSVSGCTGDATLRVWTGGSRDAFGKWVGGQKVFDGPISQGYSK